MRSGLNQGYFARSKVTVVYSEPHSIAAALLSNTTPLTEKKIYMMFNDAIQRRKKGVVSLCL